MSISVKPHHPLQELLAQLLFNIEAVPKVVSRTLAGWNGPSRLPASIEPVSVCLGGMSS